MTGNPELRRVLSYEVAQRAVYENYECIYAIDVETSAFRCYHESDSYGALLLENSGDDFFTAVRANIVRTVHHEDQAFVLRKIARAAVLAGLEREKYYAFVYRLMIEGKPVYHKLRAVRETVNGRDWILVGIRDIDEAFRQDKAQAEVISSLHRKEKNYLEAILASAAGYLEANLTQDLLLELSPCLIPERPLEAPPAPLMDATASYSGLERWISENLVVENREKYSEISSREYLIYCFSRGERRASVYFSVRAADGQVLPCKKLCFLYRDDASGDILSFCVIYDLTEQQRKEKERQELEAELQLSRIRNFTSQMQPHFLYNALGSIQEIVLEDPEYASELIGDFTVHLRSCIRAMASDTPIPFEQELANIRAYVNIERMRLGDKLHVVYDIAAKDFRVLPLSVQPIVENAIRHGVYERGGRGGMVTVRTAEEEEFWVVTVEDDGVGFDYTALQRELRGGRRDSTGLQNIMFRLDKVMRAAVDIESTVGTGTTVTIKIPKGGGNTCARS